MKRVFSLMLVICLIFSFSSVVIASDYEATNYKVSSIDSVNCVDAKIIGSELKLKIKNIRNEDACIVEIARQQEVAMGGGSYFDISFPLYNVTQGTYEVMIYLGNMQNGCYSFLNRPIYITYTMEGWNFVKNTNLVHNSNITNNSISSNKYIMPVSSEIKSFSDSIVKGSKNDIEKVVKIHTWLANNIAYDYDSISYGDSATSYMVPEYVIKHKKAVCQGVALTFQALCNAQNIPCMTYEGNAVDSKGKSARHAWNEVFINNDWFVVDTTNDLIFNIQNDGIYRSKQDDFIFNYFVFDLNSASKYLRYNAVDDLFKTAVDTLNNTSHSSWANNVLVNSIYSNVYDGSFKGDLTRPITRGEFCDLLVNYLFIQLIDVGTFNYTQGSANQILSQGKTTISHPFIQEKNSITSNILVCYVNGIVNGKSDNYFGINDYITREEAATMLVRSIDFLDKYDKQSKFNRSYNKNKSFSDRNNISSWARDNVSIINDMGIMNGVGDNKFDPKGNYTVEQSIATLYRLFEYNYRR